MWHSLISIRTTVKKGSPGSRLERRRGGRRVRTGLGIFDADCLPHCSVHAGPAVGAPRDRKLRQRCLATVTLCSRSWGGCMWPGHAAPLLVDACRIPHHIGRNRDGREVGNARSEAQKRSTTSTPESTAQPSRGRTATAVVRPTSQPVNFPTLIIPPWARCPGRLVVILGSSCASGTTAREAIEVVARAISGGTTQAMRRAAARQPQL